MPIYTAINGVHARDVQKTIEKRVIFQASFQLSRLLGAVKGFHDFAAWRPTGLTSKDIAIT